MSVQLRSILAGGFLFLLGAAACAADPAPPAAAGYKVLPVPAAWGSKKKADVDVTKPILDNIKKITQQGGTISGFEPQFEKYYQLVLFPQWTQTTQENLNGLPKARDYFIRFTLESSGKNPTAHDLLVDVTHRELSKIAQDPEFHPAVRYNAILVVGMLNATEPNRTNGKPGEPYSKALPTLLEELKKPGNNEAVRVGALMGVARHLEWDNVKPAGAANRIQPALRGEAIAVLMSIVSTKVPPAGRSPEGQTWLRRRALEALGHAYAQQLDAKFATLLDEIIVNDNEPISLRCTAAEVMSRMDFKAPAVLAVIPAAKKLGYLALYACHTELLRLDSLKKKDEELVKVAGGIAGGGMGMPGGGMPGGGMPGGGMPGMAGGAGMTMPGMGGGAGMEMPGAPGGAGAGPGGMMMPGMPGMGGGKKGSRMPGMGGTNPLANDPKAYRIDYSKRRLRAELYAVQLALGKKKRGATDENARGLIAFAKADADTKGVETITKQVEEVIREVETPDQDAVTYEKNLLAEMKKLEKLTKLLPAVVKADDAKPAAAVEDEVPGAAKTPAAKAPAEEPAEEVPMAPAAKGPAAPAKAAPPDAGKAAPADAAEAPAAGKMP